MQKKKIVLACDECKRKNYSTNKSAGNVERVAIKKYCTLCKKHTLHKEEK
ncbi:50S ribosomal protein L33 [Mycoplasmopsis alligatoris]|uniref:Large ribosomal subunit protein bL33 n=1 Tax=Mycoplasmopsis alligatoris A21JP2 TaxID=747682 RepID=D4XVL2_9BACT|nr:50S ribosomal protein L33 [Mycoplasmopsis alligatoris]EFF41658.1 ribosomal protein L33 [Mycoplasmopsis alligatoris A21JP2]